MEASAYIGAILPQSVCVRVCLCVCELALRSRCQGSGRHRSFDGLRTMIAQCKAA